MTGECMAGISLSRYRASTHGEGRDEPKQRPERVAAAR
ncbi:hypothetical protein BURCENBC7_AP1973 [Burkholderia cenocepacia BC7]|nr:hypothetical protein BURCENK562V_C7142 [Burkholderia cenocepacia K56-2Valvano]ERI29394.1 hypothetical protein BURCENBC7_AP1973 [Burkholderia cenocepacia BC7]